jgi:hypothetical protein
VLDDLDVLDKLIVSEITIGFVAIDNDLLTLEWPEVFRDVFVEEDAGPLKSVALALAKLQQVCRVSLMHRIVNPLLAHSVHLTLTITLTLTLTLTFTLTPLPAFAQGVRYHSQRTSKGRGVRARPAADDEHPQIGGVGAGGESGSGA